jgi:hypothetical protein
MGSTTCSGFCSRDPQAGCNSRLARRRWNRYKIFMVIPHVDLYDYVWQPPALDQVPPESNDPRGHFVWSRFPYFARFEFDWRAFPTWMNPTSLDTWLYLSAEVTSAVKHYETRIRLNECEASSKRRRLLKGLPPGTPRITYRAEQIDTAWINQSYIAPHLDYRYGMYYTNPPAGHRQVGPMIIGVKLPLWAYPVTVQNWLTFTPIQQVTIGTGVNQYYNHRFMMIPDEGSALNNDYSPRKGLLGYRGVPRAPDGT